MKKEDIIEALKLEAVMVALGVLCKVINVLNRFNPDELNTSAKIEKFKTKKYHVRVLIENHSSPTILIKEKGLLKLDKWGVFEKDKGTPSELMNEINSESCTPARRKYLLTKIMDLKAFW